MINITFLNYIEYFMYKNLMRKESKDEIKRQIYEIVFEFEETFGISAESEFFEHEGLKAIISGKLAFAFKLSKGNKFKILFLAVPSLRFNSIAIGNSAGMTAKSSELLKEFMVETISSEYTYKKKGSFRSDLNKFMKKGKRY